MNEGTVVVGGQQRVEFSGSRAERIGERLADPPRVGVHERHVADGVGVRRWCELVDPGLRFPPRDGAQHAVDESGTRRIEFDSRLLNGGETAAWASTCVRSSW